MSKSKYAEIMGNKSGFSIAVGNIGLVYRDQGNYHLALSSFKEKKQLCEDIGDRFGYGNATGYIGYLQYDQGKRNEAFAYFNEAIDTHRELGVKSSLTDFLIGKARVFLDWHQYADAKICVDECVAIASEISKPDTYFEVRVLQAKINLIGYQNPSGLQTLQRMLSKTNSSTFQGRDQQATLHYELWKLLTTLDTHFLEGSGYLDAPEQAEEHRQAALGLYQKLYEKTPKYEYKKRIEELTLA